MLFFDFAFLYAFLPVALGVYYALPARARNGWLFVASSLFYASSSLRFLPLLWLSVLVDYAAGEGLARAEGARARKRWLLLSLGVNLGILAFFKYAGFLTLNLRALFGEGQVPLLEAALPIGISFYTFQSMSYTIDLYRGRIQRVRSIVDFAAYVTMFPQLIAGPIVRFSHLESQLREREHDVERFASGLYTFVVGLAKKLLVADTLAALAAPLFAAGSPGFFDAWLAMLLFAGQIYFDFSGYSDMAVGLGRLFGFELPRNFDAPYRATSFSDFWRRWHITLSSWLRDYLYIPLGGNRRGALRTAVNLAVTMLLGGLWHGASWNFVLWGGLHGALLGIERALRGVVAVPPLAVRRALVFVAVVLAWTPFKLETFGETVIWWSAMAGLSGWGQADLPRVLGVGVFLALVWMPPLVLAERPRFRVRDAWIVASLFVAALLVGYGNLDPSPFLYFRF
ncbi:MAG: MBOAT family O-acyltransferase [Myxococcota bacterium]